MERKEEISENGVSSCKVQVGFLGCSVCGKNLHHHSFFMYDQFDDKCFTVPSWITMLCNILYNVSNVKDCKDFCIG